MPDSVSKKPGKLIQIDKEQIREHLANLFRGTVEDAVNNLLEAVADQVYNVICYERTDARKDTRAQVIISDKLHTKAGEVTLNVPKLRKQKFETSIIERYKHRESPVESALIEMYLAPSAISTKSFTRVLKSGAIGPLPRPFHTFISMTLFSNAHWPESCIMYP